METKFYDLKELQELLKCSNRTLRRYILTGKLNAIKTGGKFLVSEADLNKFIDLQKVKH